MEFCGPYSSFNRLAGAVTLDTRQAVKDLREAGFTEEQAERLASLAYRFSSDDTPIDTVKTVKWLNENDLFPWEQAEAIASVVYDIQTGEL